MRMLSANYILGFEFLLTVGVVITTLILILLNQKKSATHRRLLFVFFGLVLCFFLHHYATHHRILWLYLPTKLFYDGIGLLLGPLVYFYIRSIYQSVDFRQRRVWKHFIPYLLYWWLITLPFTFSSPENGLVFDYLKWYVEYGEWLYWMEMGWLLVYTLLAGKYWQQIRTTAKSFYADFQPKDWLWSKRLLQGIVLYILTDFLLFIYLQLAPPNDYYLDPFINVPIILFVIGYLGYAGFFQAKILIPNFLLAKENNLSVSTPTVLNKPPASFSSAEIATIKTKLTQVLAEQQFYLNDSITLTDLAKAVDLTDKKLSNFINQILDTNFYELINEYRLTAFKTQAQLAEHQHLTIWGIASQCGFKSKSTFHRIFKQKMGITPSTYLQQMRVEKDKNA